jgi:hypothetical protein
MEFDTQELREECLERLKALPRNVIRAVHPVSSMAMNRIMGNETPIPFKGH